MRGRRGQVRGARHGAVHRDELTHRLGERWLGRLGERGGFLGGLRILLGGRGGGFRGRGRRNGRLVARGGRCEDGFGFGCLFFRGHGFCGHGLQYGGGRLRGCCLVQGFRECGGLGHLRGGVRQLGRGVRRVGDQGFLRGGRGRELPYGDTRYLDVGYGVHRLRLALGGYLRGDGRRGLLVGLGGELGLRRRRNVRDELRVRYDRLFRYDRRVRVQYGFRLRNHGFCLRYDDQGVLGLRHRALGLLRSVRRLSLRGHGGRLEDGAGLGVPGGGDRHDGVRGQGASKAYAFSGG